MDGAPETCARLGWLQESTEPGPWLFQSLEALAEAKRLKAEAGRHRELHVCHLVGLYTVVRRLSDFMACDGHIWNHTTPVIPIKGGVA